MPIQMQKFRAPKQLARPLNAQESLSSATAASQRQLPMTRIDSLRAMHGFLHSTLGTLFFLRDLFPVDHFRNFVFGKTDNPSASQSLVLSQSQSSQSDRLVVKTLDRDSDLISVIESYTMNFFYADNGFVSLDIAAKVQGADPTRLGHACTPDDFRSQTKMLMKSIVDACKDLNDLPQQKYLDFKLFLKSDTPKDYKLPHLKVVNEDLRMTTKSLMDAPLFRGQGQAAQSGHHGISFRLTTVVQSFGDAPSLGGDDGAAFKNGASTMNKGRKVVWDPALGVEDRIELDPSIQDPLQPQDHLGSTLRQPLGWLLPGGHLKKVVAGVPDSDEEDQSPRLVAVHPTNAIRDGVFKRSGEMGVNGRRLAGWSRVSPPPALEQETIPNATMSPVTRDVSTAVNLVTNSHFRASSARPLKGPQRSSRQHIDLDDDDFADDHPRKRKCQARRPNSASKTKAAKMKTKASTRTKNIAKSVLPSAMGKGPVPSHQSKNKAATKTNPIGNAPIEDAHRELMTSNTDAGSRRAMDATANQIPTSSNSPQSTVKATKAKAMPSAASTMSSLAPVARLRDAGTNLQTPIDCYCELEDEEDSLIRCHDCQRRLHLACCGYLKPDMVPLDFQCINCLIEDETSPDDIQGELNALAIFRRVLYLVRSKGSLDSAVHIKDSLGIDAQQADATVRRLTSEGFVYDPRNGKRQYPRKWVNTARQNKLLQGYFEPGGRVERELFKIKPKQLTATDGLATEKDASGGKSATNRVAQYDTRRCEEMINLSELS
ncbi:hypothetical protein BD324DRAFT_653041 [Kockovaella imperatae]|uniref:HORMA domain-containing protein n=1 Tax=Kockovaella imperatae TaxID=4999 RepID=A0A1Y1U9S5_9TREE|nr:hypothetical protein BD324DRAFT_653041 [Kockovaella imperatae]ORX34783.1 hypothetical protein BD324DRAFT_653041 [Kockovaella imperatae]